MYPIFEKYVLKRNINLTIFLHLTSTGSTIGLSMGEAYVLVPAIGLTVECF